MPISIKNSETEALARKLAELTGESITNAVRTAVSERYERVRRERSRHTLAAELAEIGRSCARLPILSTMTDDEILGYDEFGIPTK
jgi:antitoxin VapB